MNLFVLALAIAFANIVARPTDLLAWIVFAFVWGVGGLTLYHERTR